MLTTTMHACAVAPARVATGRRAGAAFRHQVSRPACAAPALLRAAPRRAVAVRASSGSDAREQQLAEVAELASGLTPAGLSLAALLASPLLLDAQARAALAQGLCRTASRGSAAASRPPRPADQIKRAGRCSRRR
jgi:hypothetical protein